MLYTRETTLTQDERERRAKIHAILTGNGKPEKYAADAVHVFEAGKYIGYLQLNPLSWLFESYHSVLFYKTWPNPTTFTLMLVFAFLSLTLGYLMFAKLRPRIPEEV